MLQIKRFFALGWEQIPANSQEWASGGGGVVVHVPAWGRLGRFGAKKELSQCSCSVEGQAYCPSSAPVPFILLIPGQSHRAYQSTSASQDLCLHFGTPWDLTFMQH